MARETHDREDLLREATALVERAELQLPDYDEPLVVGFRRDGSGSIFLGADPVFQFNSAGQLRRAFRDGRLLKAEQAGLVSFERHRTASEVQLVRHELSETEIVEFRQFAERHLQRVQWSLEAGLAKVVGQVPESADVAARARDWLKNLPRPLQFARRPHSR